jgi:hypothetical protein
VPLGRVVEAIFDDESSCAVESSVTGVSPFAGSVQNPTVAAVWRVHASWGGEHQAHRVDRSEYRTRHPWADAADSRDRVPHDESRLRALRNGQFGIR